MIFGIGTDIISVARIQRSIENNERFTEKLFTPAEITYCEVRANKYQSYAARFAAKEAVMKAIGTGWDGVINWLDIEVVSDALGKPGIVAHAATQAFLEQHGITNVQLSLSHEKEYAIAFVVLEVGSDANPN